MGTFGRILALASQSFPVAGVLLSQPEESINGTLVCPGSQCPARMSA